MEKQLKIVFVSAEVDPFSKRGGLADVARSLPRALEKLGHQVIIVTPLYGTIDKEKFRLKLLAKDVPVEIDETTTLKADFWRGKLRDLAVYFVDNKNLFSKVKHIYGAKNSGARFIFFNLATLKLLEHLQFSPDIIQCNDWHTGLIPYFLKKNKFNHSLFKNTATVYTIHNLSFQSGINWWRIPFREKDNGRKELPLFNQSKKLEYINFAKRAILYSTVVNTVSEQYANEILTREFGQDLHRILKNKKKKKRLFGIINGIDYQDYNPETDPGLKANYSIKTLDKKVKNKIYLQRKFQLPQNPEIPLLGIVSRITEQKGFDILADIIDSLLRLDFQLVVWGSGEKRYEKFFRKIQKENPKKIAASLELDTKHATRVYAGSDIFLMPSRFEPCGLGQLISLRYGSIPVVHAVGGLVDTITDFNPRTGKGNGFVFRRFNSQDFLAAIVRALETYKHKEIWTKLVKRGMKLSFTWEVPARKYVTLFKRAVRLKKESNN